MRSPAQPSCRAAGREQAPNCGTSISLELQVQPVCGGPHAGINAQSGRRAGGRARLSIRCRSLAAEPLHRPPRSSLPSHELDSDPVRLWGACSADVVMSASLIGRLGSSTFRPSAAAVSMSLTGSCFSSESAPGPFHHGIRRRGGTIFWAALPIASAGPSGHANSPHPSSREGHHSTARWSSSVLLLD